MWDANTLGRKLENTSGSDARCFNPELQLQVSILPCPLSILVYMGLGFRVYV